MVRIVFALPPLLLLAMMPQDTPAPDKIPADAAAAVNPVHAAPESLARAKSRFDVDCGLCHGVAGDGKGDVVADLKLPMKDWTASPSALDGMKDGEIFYIIKNGNGKMPPEAGRAKDEDLWTLVIYVRSLARKP